MILILVGLKRLRVSGPKFSLPYLNLVITLSYIAVFSNTSDSVVSPCDTLRKP